MYLFRHGETLWNRQRRMQGRLDSPLTARGLAQAQAMGARIAEILGRAPERRFLCSPLGRSGQTAVIMAEELDYPVDAIERVDALREMTWGDWDGLTGDEISARDPELWQARLNDKFTIAPPGGGEHQQAIYDRARGWLESLERTDDLIVVAHGAFNRALLSAYLKQPAAHMLSLSEPQDGFFELKDGRIRLIEMG